jgi:hypothetical protein
MGKERPRDGEIDEGVIDAYAATFISRMDMYPLQLADGRYISIRKPLSLDLIMAHLKGTITLGAYALDQENRAKWLCLDADDRDQWSGLWRMAHVLHQQGVTPYLEPSRRGGHLWLFFSPLSGADVRRFGIQLLAGHDLLDVELFPKHDELKTGPGSLVRLPLGCHQKTGRRYHFVSLSGEPLAPTVREQIHLRAAPERVPQDYIGQVLKQAPAPVEFSPTPEFTPPAGEVTGETLSERLKRRISVYDFVSQYVALDGQGRGFCPFHPDEHKSFGVNASKNFWHCFAGCGGGSIIDFLMLWREKNGEDSSFTATVRALAKMLL